MEGLFRCMPENPGAGFVIVTHLSPERESLLHEVVARYTAMPVLVAEDGVAVERDCVYVMPENAILIARNLGPDQIAAVGGSVTSGPQLGGGFVI